jgi:hypothetical protein
MNTGSAPACNLSDFTKAIGWLNEYKTAPPCDDKCDPKTHCCLDINGLLGGGGSSGLPIDAGLPSSSSGGTGGACVSN